MSLESNIRQRWIDDPTLVALVPPPQTFTGAAVGNPDLPYLVLTIGPSEVVRRTSSATTVRKTQAQFNLWSDRHLLASQILAEITRRFDRSHFDLTDGSVLNMQLDTSHLQLLADGTWHLKAEFIVLSQHAPVV